MYLENIYSPADVKKLSFKELNDLSNEIRASLLQKLSEHGGHFGPNFGMVEATIRFTLCIQFTGRQACF